MNRRQFLKQTTTAAAVAAAAPAVIAAAAEPTSLAFALEYPFDINEGETIELVGWIAELPQVKAVKKVHIYINNQFIDTLIR
jgi:hypothetical protein